MSLAPLLAEGMAIRWHAFAAFAALLVGTVQLAAPKGTLPHRTIGYLWAGLMLFVAVSSLWIHELRFVGRWSPTICCRSPRLHSCRCWFGTRGVDALASTGEERSSSMYWRFS